MVIIKASRVFNMPSVVIRPGRLVARKYARLDRPGAFAYPLVMPIVRKLRAVDILIFAGAAVNLVVFSLLFYFLIFS